MSDDECGGDEIKSSKSKLEIPAEMLLITGIWMLSVRGFGNVREGDGLSWFVGMVEVLGRENVESFLKPELKPNPGMIEGAGGGIVIFGSVTVGWDTWLESSVSLTVDTGGGVWFDELSGLGIVGSVDGFFMPIVTKVNLEEILQIMISVKLASVLLKC